jgi:hypothetical protein
MIHEACITDCPGSQLCTTTHQAFISLIFNTENHPATRLFAEWHRDLGHLPTGIGHC